MEDQNTMTEILRARCTPELKRRLEALALRQAGDVSDHIRFAVETYVMEQEAKQAPDSTLPANPELVTK